MSVSWLRLLIGEFAIIASCVQANAKKEVFIALTACGRWTHIDCVGFCERVLDIRGIDFVCRTCAHCGEDDEYDWGKSIDDQKTFHLLGECGFDITLWSLCGHFSLWPFWFVAVLDVRLFIKLLLLFSAADKEIDNKI